MAGYEVSLSVLMLSLLIAIPLDFRKFKKSINNHLTCLNILGIYKFEGF